MFNRRMVRLQYPTKKVRKHVLGRCVVERKNNHNKRLTEKTLSGKHRQRIYNHTDVVWVGGRGSGEDEGLAQWLQCQPG